MSDYFFDNNTYYKPYGWPGQSFYIPPAYIPGSCGYWWLNRQSKGYGYCDKTKPASWQDDLGYDLHSTYIAALPTGTKIYFAPDKYNPARAILAIYNWDHKDTVALPAADVAQVLKPGDNYELHNAADYYGDIAQGVYDGGDLSVSMLENMHTVAVPIGYTQTLGPNTFPDFGAFILIDTTQSP